jgi:hypothetical protein
MYVRVKAALVLMGDIATRKVLNRGCENEHCYLTSLDYYFRRKWPNC